MMIEIKIRHHVRPLYSFIFYYFLIPKCGIPFIVMSAPMQASMQCLCDHATLLLLAIHTATADNDESKANNQDFDISALITAGCVSFPYQRYLLSKNYYRFISTQ